MNKKFMRSSTSQDWVGISLDRTQSSILYWL